jgi:hypothetical protein
MVYPALLPLMRTPRLPVVDWTEAPADLNWFVRFAERRNLVSAGVPSHFNWPLYPYHLGFRYADIRKYQITHSPGRLKNCLASYDHWSFVGKWYIRKPANVILITPWSSVLLEQLTDFQLVKKLPASYGNRRLITAFTSPRHLSLSWASSIQSVPPSQFLEIHLNIILSAVSFPQASPPKPCTLPSPAVRSQPVHCTVAHRE